MLYTLIARYKTLFQTAACKQYILVKTVHLGYHFPGKRPFGILPFGKKTSKFDYKILFSEKCIQKNGFGKMFDKLLLYVINRSMLYLTLIMIMIISFLKNILSLFTFVYVVRASTDFVTAPLTTPNRKDSRHYFKSLAVHIFPLHKN